MKFLKENPTITMIVIFLLSVTLAVLDPLSIDSNGEEGTSLVKIWYLLPGALLFFIVIVRPSIGTRGVNAASEEDIRREKIKSLIRHLLTSLTAVIALKAGLGLNIPYIDGIFELLKYSLGQTDHVINSIMTLMSFATIVYGFFKQGMRFEQTAKSNSKGRKYEPQL